MPRRCLHNKTDTQHPQRSRFPICGCPEPLLHCVTCSLRHRPPPQALGIGNRFASQFGAIRKYSLAAKEIHNLLRYNGSKGPFCGRRLLLRAVAGPAGDSGSHTPHLESLLEKEVASGC